MSWLAKVGLFIGKILGVVSKAEPTAVSLAEVLLPQFSGLIAGADIVFKKIMTEVIAAETAMSAISKAGPQKLSAVLAAVGPVVDGWIAAQFPGSKQISDATKNGMINAVVALLNEVQADVAPPAA